jgi:hypothetical protein
MENSIARRGRTRGRVLGLLLALVAVVTAGILGTVFYFSTSSIHELLTENRELSAAIRNLTEETQIGYAKVQSQGPAPNGGRQTVVRFVQTAAGSPREIVSEQLFTIEGEVVHFDALIVKFGDEFVKDGSERALYLWRRIYGENTGPGEGQPIEIPGSAPERYYAVTRTLRLKEQDLFWEAVWDLANDPQRLEEYGIRAVFGNAIYTRVQPGKVYLFKISPTGQIYPEVVPDY